GIIEDGAVYSEGARLVDVGTTDEVLARHPRADLRIEAAGKVVAPGFVDPHTHPVFAGSREHEVEWKSQGLSYSEIAARGGGILHTVRATRESSEGDLARDATKRLRSMAASGTTTVEAKSGYGLRTDDELKILRAIAAAGHAAEIDVVPTFLGAHAVPPEFQTRPEAYVNLVREEMLPAIAANRLADFCDAFVDRGYFSANQAREILKRGADLGLRPKVHADELSDAGGAALAAELGAASADHLIHTSSDGIEAMARSRTIAILLPAASLASRLPFADGRRLLAAGVAVAIGTDFNPNCWCDSMPLAIALACHHNGLTPAEAINAATVNAAHADDARDDPRAVPNHAVARDHAVHNFRGRPDGASFQDDALLHPSVRVEPRSLVEASVVHHASLSQDHGGPDVTGTVDRHASSNLGRRIEDDGAFARDVLAVQRPPLA